MHKVRFKVVGSLEDDFYTGMSKDSTKFLTEARNIENRAEDMFLDYIYLQSAEFLNKII